MRAAREAGGYRQEDLASPLGVSVSRISSWENVETDEGPPAKGFKILRYMVALLQRPRSRDALLRELGADDGLAPPEDPELQRRLDLVRRAYRQRDHRLVRSVLETLEAALEEFTPTDDSDIVPRGPALRVAEPGTDYGGAIGATAAEAPSRRSRKQ